MAKLVFDVNLPAYRYQEMYRGKVKFLLVFTHQGLKLKLPLLNFRPFLTHKGIYGTFEVLFDERHKLIELKKLA